MVREYEIALTDRVPVPTPWVYPGEGYQPVARFTVRITNDHSVTREPYGLVVSMHSEELTIPWHLVRWVRQYDGR
jgi:hypothetical protein